MKKNREPRPILKYKPGCQFMRKKFSVPISDKPSVGKKCMKDCANEGPECDACRPIVWNKFVQRQGEK